MEKATWDGIAGQVSRPGKTRLKDYRLRLGIAGAAADKRPENLENSLQLRELFRTVNRRRYKIVHLARSTRNSAADPIVARPVTSTWLGCGGFDRFGGDG